MGRYNGTFRYSPLAEARRDPETGFLEVSGSRSFIDGGLCQIEKSIPARQLIGEDGQTHAYTYDVFIPRTFGGSIGIGTVIELTDESGGRDSFTVQGVDDQNRKYIELWG